MPSNSPRLASLSPSLSKPPLLPSLSPLESLPPELKLLVLHSLPDHDALTHLLRASPDIPPLYALNRSRILASIIQNYETVRTRTALATLAARGIPLLDLPYDALGYVEISGPWGSWEDTTEACLAMDEVFNQAYRGQGKGRGGAVQLSMEQRGRLMDVLAVQAWTIRAEDGGTEPEGQEPGQQKLVRRLLFEQKTRIRERVAKGGQLRCALKLLHVGDTEEMFDERLEEWYAAREPERSRRRTGVQDILDLAIRVVRVLMKVALWIYIFAGCLGLCCLWSGTSRVRGDFAVGGASDLRFVVDAWGFGLALADAGV